MDTFTQTSNCGYSRKQSAVSLLTKYQNQYGHQRRQSVRSLALQSVAVDSETAADNGNLSLASLHIQGLKPPETLSSGPLDPDRKPRGQLGDYPHGDRSGSAPNGSDYAPDVRDFTKSDGVIVTESHSNPRGGSKTPGHRTESQRRHKATRKKPIYVSFGHSSHPLPEHNEVSDTSHDALRQNETPDSRGLENIVTYGEFVSRRPPPAFRSKSDLRQQQQRTSRDGCCSVVTALGGGQGQAAGQSSVTSVIRARRGKSAGDIKYCGRPCDACSLQKLQQWEKEQETEETYAAENSTKLYVTNSATSHRSQGRKLQPGSGHSGRGVGEGVGGGGGQFTEMAQVTRVSMPGRGLPKLTGLQHELADPSFYERGQRQDVTTNHHHHQHSKGSWQDPDSRRPRSVVRNRAMLRHVRLGSELLRGGRHNDDDNRADVITTGDCRDLLETILLYEIPGVSKMKNDYRGLVDITTTTAVAATTGGRGVQLSSSEGRITRVLSANGRADQLQATPPIGLSSTQTPSQFFPSVLPGQRS